MKLYGKNPVFERLRSNPKSIKKIFVEEGHRELPYLRQKGHKWGIPVICVPASKMLKMGRSWNTQGILVEVDDFAYVPFEDLLDQAQEKKQTILFLDGITDPQNLGSIMRAVACLGDFVLVLPRHDSASVTDTVLRVCAGGENYIAVAQVANLNQAILKAKECDFWIAGMVVEGGENIYNTAWPQNVGLVIGSEQNGIRETIRKNLDAMVTIPMAHPRLSLNVATATAICAYEIMRQNQSRRKKE